ncbi:MAG: hypothetical protein ACR2MW_07910 [Chthoniobacterales bacterium]
MRLALVAITFFLAAAPALQAEPPRTALAGAAQIAGRKIGRVRLLAPLVVDDSRFAVYVRDAIEIRIPAGTFVPVSEDKGGAYFQSVKQFARIKFPGPADGGLYISRKKANHVEAYLGDARAGSKSAIDKARILLTADQIRYLRFEAPGAEKK